MGKQKVRKVGITRFHESNLLDGNVSLSYLSIRVDVRLAAVVEVLNEEDRSENIPSSG